MGRLLQKLVDRVVPSWLTKIKSSAMDPSQKKLALPYFKGSTHLVSSSSPSSSTTTHDTEVPQPLLAYDNPDQYCKGEAADADDDEGDDDTDDDDPCAKACTEKSVALVSLLLIKEHTPKPTPHRSTHNQAHQHRHHNDPHRPQQVDADISGCVNKGIQNQAHQHRHQHHNDPHPPQQVDADISGRINKGMHQWHDAKSCDGSGTSSSSGKQDASITQIDKHDNHPQQQHKIRIKDQPGLEKTNKCKPVRDNIQHHHEVQRRSGHCDAKRQELCDFLNLDREGNVRPGQQFCLSNDHDCDYSHGGETEEENYESLYRDLQGLKRKSQYLQAEEEEEETDGGRRCQSGSRKRERGVTSCELPESICGMVGNGRAVVRHSRDPNRAMGESMVEMIVGNGLWDVSSLEFLLFCYLSLNEPHLHPIICSSFLHVLQDLQKIIQ